MPRMKIEKNKFVVKKGYFLSLAMQGLTPCEYKCLMILLEGEEQTKAQISSILNDTPQHVGKAMLHLEQLGIIEHTRTEGRNSFFKINLDFDREVQADPNQLKFI